LASGVPDPQDIHAGVWHAHTLATPTEAVQATGDALLDAHLPGGGWPVGALVELLQPAGAHSEWRLLLPALAACGRGPVVMVGPPQLPFAPALSRLGLRSGRLLSVLASATAGEGARIKDEASGRLWATEQVLRCAEVDAVLAWLPQARGDQLRRLHLAAAEHHKLLFVMRPDRARSDASPAVLRLLVQPMARARHALQGPLHGRWLDGLEVDILKRRGPPLAEPLHLQARSQQLGLLLAASRALTQGVEQERVSAWGMLSDTPLDAQATRAAFQQQALGRAQSQALPWPPLPPAQSELAAAAHGAADGHVDVEAGHALDRAAAVA
jgi:protein ImuA